MHHRKGSEGPQGFLRGSWHAPLGWGRCVMGQNHNNECNLPAWLREKQSPRHARSGLRRHRTPPVHLRCVACESRVRKDPATTNKSDTHVFSCLTLQYDRENLRSASPRQIGPGQAPSVLSMSSISSPAGIKQISHELLPVILPDPRNKMNISGALRKYATRSAPRPVKRQRCDVLSNTHFDLAKTHSQTAH